MRLFLKGFSALILGAMVWSPSAYAQVTDQKVNALVDALRQAAPKTATKDDGLASEWQVLPSNIPRWSKFCSDRSISPAEFAANPTTARSIVTCIVRDALEDEYPASGQEDAIAVRRVAAWWMTGDANKYNAKEIAPYLQKVVGFYQQGVTAQPPAAQPQESAFDRYMRLGYNASQTRDYQTALINFRRALEARPSNAYATQAIRNTETNIQRSRGTTSSSRPTSQPQATDQSTAKPKPQSTPQPSISNAQSTPQPKAQVAPASSSESATLITQAQATTLINQWLAAKAQIFAPPFDSQLVNQFTTGQLRQDLTSANGAIAWLKTNQAHYQFGVQKVESVERFVANGNKASAEVKVTEDRTLYHQGNVDPRHTSFSTQVIRYSLQAVDGTWKIADYKTVDGSLLERAAK